MNVSRSSFSSRLFRIWNQEWVRRVRVSWLPRPLREDTGAREREGVCACVCVSERERERERGRERERDRVCACVREKAREAGHCQRLLQAGQSGMVGGCDRECVWQRVCVRESVCGRVCE